VSGVTSGCRLYSLALCILSFFFLPGWIVINTVDRPVRYDQGRSWFQIVSF